jgi:hypothetical protein
MPSRVSRLAASPVRVAAVIFLALIAATACPEKTRSPVDADTGSSADSTPATTPQLGGGEAACSSEDACRADCQRIVTTLAQPAPPRPASTSSKCEKVNFGGTATMPPPGPTPPGCYCQGPAGGIMLQPGLGQTCLLSGRVFQCLYTEAEFPGCDPAAPDTSCAAICADVDRRFNQDLATPAAATLQASRCTPGACHCVVKTSDQCHLWPWSTPYDCTLPLEEIVRREYERLNPPPPDAGIATPPTDQRQICAESIHCGISLACKDGHCDKCTADAECASGEGCALGACLRKPYIGCRSQADCTAPNTVCLSTGITGGYPRGNEATVSRCVSLAGGRGRIGYLGGFSHIDQPSGCAAPEAACAQRIRVASNGTITREGAGVPGGSATGQLPETELRALAQFVDDPMTSWVLESPFTCSAPPGQHVLVETVSGDGHTVRADVAGCVGPPFDQITRWVTRLRALAGGP